MSEEDADHRPHSPSGTSTASWSEEESQEQRACSKKIQQLQLKNLLIANCGVRRRANEGDKIFLRRVSHLHLNGKHLTSSSLDWSELCPRLDTLYLYDNQLDSLGFLRKVRELTHVYVENNNLKSLDGLQSRKLIKLLLDGNCIEHLEGLEVAGKLRELHMANQRIPVPLTFSAETMRALGQSLLHLNVSGNGIEDVELLTELSSLERLNLSANAVSCMSQVADLVLSLGNMRELDLRGNPVCRSHKYYERTVARSQRVLTLLDGRVVPQEHRKMLCNLERHTRKVGTKSVPKLHQSSSNDSVSVEGEALGEFSGFHAALY